MCQVSGVLPNAEKNVNIFHYKSLQEIVFGPVSFFRVKTVGVSMNIIWIFFPFHLLRQFLIDRNVVSTESPFWRKQWLATDYGMWIWMHIIECGKLWNIYNSQSKGLREVIKCHLSLLSLRFLKVQCKTLKLTFEPGNVINRNLYSDWSRRLRRLGTEYLHFSYF